MNIGDLVKFAGNRVIGSGDQIGIIVAIGNDPPSAIIRWSESNTESFISIDALEVLSHYEER